MEKKIIFTEAEIAEYQSRLESLSDKNMASAKLGISNLLLHFNENIIGAQDKDIAESFMVELEEMDNSLVDVYEQFRIDENMRQIRALLSGSDWLFIADVPVSKDHRGYYKNYRQYLRDLKHSTKKIMTIEEYLRLNQPQLFLDGGKGKEIVNKFNTYITRR